MAKLNIHQLEEAIRDAGAVVYGISEGIWRFLEEYKSAPLGDQIVSDGICASSTTLFDLLQAKDLDRDALPQAVAVYHLAARATIAHFETHHHGFPGPAFLCRGLQDAANRLHDTTSAWCDLHRTRALVAKEVP